MSDIIEWLRDRAFRKSGPTMEASHTKQQEWIWADEIELLRAENEKLRAVLAFYADGDNWRLNGPLDANSGNFTGGPATAALKEKWK